MRRYCGDAFSEGGRIAVISNDALGNFVVVTPLLQLLRTELRPSQIDYYGGYRTWELQAESDLFEWSYPFHGSADAERAQTANERRGYDLVINVERTKEAKIFAGRLCTESSQVCGPCGDVPGHDLDFYHDSRGDLWRDEDWTAEDITERYPFLQSPFIGEIFCRLAYLKGPLPAYEVACEPPDRPVPDVLISTAGTLPEKLWPAHSWIKALEFLRSRGVSVGLLGAAPSQQRHFWKGDEAESLLIERGLVEDLRGQLRLPEVVGALQKCKLVLTLDNGILHLAVAARKHTIGIYRYGIHRLWAPPSPALTVLAPPRGGEVSDISPETVIEAVGNAL